MKTVLHGGMLAFCVLSCTVNNQGSSLLLSAAVVPAAPPSCTVSADSTTFFSVGTVDVLDFNDNPNPQQPIARDYVYSGLLLNQLSPTGPSNNAESFASYTQIQTDANNVLVDGFYVTYVVNSQIPAPADPGQELTSGTTAFVGANAQVLVFPNNKGVASAFILPNEVMSQLLINNAGTSCTFGSLTVPCDFTVTAHIKADAHTQDGRRLQSNETVFPIRVCYGCLHSCATAAEYDLTSVCSLGQDSVAKCKSATAP